MHFLGVGLRINLVLVNEWPPRHSKIGVTLTLNLHHVLAQSNGGFELKVNTIQPKKLEKEK